MKKEGICFECGFRYNRRKASKCPRCGEEKLFIAAIHSADYDISKDPKALLRLRLQGLAIFAVFSIVILNYFSK